MDKDILRTNILEKQIFVMELLLNKHRVIFNPAAEEELCAKGARLGLCLTMAERQHFAVVIVKYEESKEAYAGPEELLMLGENIFSKKFRCCGIISGGRLVYYLSATPDNTKGQLTPLANEVVQKIERLTHSRCAVGVSSPTEHITNISSAYDEADFVIRYLQARAGGVYYVGDIISGLQVDYGYVGDVVGRFEGLLKMGSKKELENYIDELFSEKNVSSVSKAGMDMVSFQILVVIYRFVYEVANSSEAQNFLTSQLISKKTIAGKEEILRLSIQAREIMANQRKQNADLLCDRAIHIIETEYADETLSLAAISERLHVSASYMSAILRKNRDTTFVNLLTAKRMTAAREYLRNTSMKVMEIARRCGYSDQHYFSYCFKRYYGESPNKIRKMSLAEVRNGENAAL